MVVIVVIAILAAISIVTYNNVQSRTHAAAVQNDLRQMGNALELHRGQYGTYPSAQAEDLAEELQEQGFTGLSRDSYSAGPGTHVGGHNLAVCRLSDGTKMALVAESKSGVVFGYQDGSSRQLSMFDSLPGISTTCQEVLAADRDQLQFSWIFHQGEWKF